MKKLKDLIHLEKKSDVEIRYCEIVADKEDVDRRVRILKDGERYFYHEMRSGEVTACFEVAESWRPWDFIIFAWTPDDRHVYEIETRNLTARPTIHKLEDASDGDSFSDLGHAVTLDGDHLVVDGKRIPVTADREWAWKIMKTKIRAIGGAKGLFIELENKAEERRNGIYPLFSDLINTIAEKVNPQAERRKA